MRDILPFHIPQLVKSDPFTVIYLIHTQSSSFLVKHSLSTSPRCLTLFWVRGVPQENCPWKLYNKSFWYRSINPQKFIENSQIFTKLSYDNVCQWHSLHKRVNWLLPRCYFGSCDALLALYMDRPVGQNKVAVIDSRYREPLVEVGLYMKWCW